MCAEGRITLRVPRPVRILFDAAVRAVREACGGWPSRGACLGRMAEHFIATWEPLLPRRRTRAQRVLDRDGGHCQAPGCSRPAGQAHHIVLRSAGGEDDDRNLTSLCVVHHLHGVHASNVSVRGEAPDRLEWRLGPRA